MMFDLIFYTCSSIILADPSVCTYTYMYVCHRTMYHDQVRGRIDVVTCKTGVPVAIYIIGVDIDRDGLSLSS